MLPFRNASFLRRRLLAQDAPQKRDAYRRTRRPKLTKMRRLPCFAIFSIFSLKFTLCKAPNRRYFLHFLKKTVIFNDYNDLLTFFCALRAAFGARRRRNARPRPFLRLHYRPTFRFKSKKRRRGLKTDAFVKSVTTILQRRANLSILTFFLPSLKNRAFILRFRKKTKFFLFFPIRLPFSFVPLV